MPERKYTFYQSVSWLSPKTWSNYMLKLKKTKKKFIYILLIIMDIINIL